MSPQKPVLFILGVYSCSQYFFVGLFIGVPSFQQIFVLYFYRLGKVNVIPNVIKGRFVSTLLREEEKKMDLRVSRIAISDLPQMSEPASRPCRAGQCVHSVHHHSS